MCACHVSLVEPDVIIWPYRWRRSTCTCVTHGNVVDGAVRPKTEFTYRLVFCASANYRNQTDCRDPENHRWTASIELDRSSSLLPSLPIVRNRGHPRFPNLPVFIRSRYNVLAHTSNGSRIFLDRTWPSVFRSIYSPVFLFSSVFTTRLRVFIFCPRHTSKPSRSVLSNFVHYRSRARLFVSLPTHSFVTPLVRLSMLISITVRPLRRLFQSIGSTL